MSFDNVTPQAVLHGLQWKGIDENLVLWFDKFLSGWRIETENLGVKIQRKLTLGTPQGGVVSPLLWNLAFDEFTSLYDGQVHL